MLALAHGHRRRAVAAVLLPVAVLCASACAPETSDITVSAAFVPVPANPAEAAAYLTIDNAGGGDDELTGATSDVASVVHLHESTISDDGLATMTMSKTLPIPAGETVALRPGGLHLMLDSPSQLSEGDTVKLMLTFREAGQKKVTAEVITDVSEVFGS